MITEDYVSFEIAKLLKEKGFDWNTDKQFNLDKIVGDYNITDRSRHPERYLDAPTLQIAMKWLREVHNIHPNIVVEMYGPYPLYKIDRICDGDEEKWVDFENEDNFSSLYSTYEEACEAAIKYCLENLI